MYGWMLLQTISQVLDMIVTEKTQNSLRTVSYTHLDVYKRQVLVVDFKGQVAVKKVTIVIQGTKKNNNLAEISKVEFLNDMENRIPAPTMDVPEGLKAEAGNESFVLTWKEAKNITGYEVKISDGNTSEVRKTASTKMEVTTFNNDELINKQEYKVSIQSVNGEWRSGYSEEITVVPFTRCV